MDHGAGRFYGGVLLFKKHRFGNEDYTLKIGHSNDKDYVPFSRMCLELVTIQKHTDTNMTRHKNMPMQKDTN